MYVFGTMLGVLFWCWVVKQADFKMLVLFSGV